MLTDQQKSDIQDAYSRFLEARGFNARHCQKLMIAEIARLLGSIECDDNGQRTSEQANVLLEAGTGTGKTVAYLLAGIPIARSLGKKLVVSTATVALQEQIVLQDLPDIAANSGLQFEYALAKGRRRYLCMLRLDQTLGLGVDGKAAQIALYPDEAGAGEPVQADERGLYEQMLDLYARGDWDGDGDGWPTEVAPHTWRRITSDSSECLGRRCSHIANCSLFRARDKLRTADVIVANHDLVLSNLPLGSSSVLPDPADCLFVFDEAHHLPDKAIDHASHDIALVATSDWLGRLPAIVATVVTQAQLDADITARIEDAAADLREPYLAFRRTATGLMEQADGLQLRFPQGRADETLVALAADCVQAVETLMAAMSPLVNGIDSNLDAAADGERDGLEAALPQVQAMLARLGEVGGLMHAYAHEDDPESPPTARWLQHGEAGTEVHVQASPIDVSAVLQELLFEPAYGVVMTSATLSVGGDFSRILDRCGLPEETAAMPLPSPFYFAEQAVLRVPAMSSDPRDSRAHTAEVASLLPGLVAEGEGTLVLFNSWGALRSVRAKLEEPLAAQVLAQGELGKQALLDAHVERVNRQETSVIFGVASFAEGIDLPGAYCRSVVVTRLPFAVPDDPVQATLFEWVEERGGNSFVDISVPDATLRLVQACGRLLRTEEDHGTITILDRRLVKTGYGKRMLKALPPFRQEID